MITYYHEQPPDRLIDGVVVHKLRVNRDARGLLVETLRTDWADVYDANDRPFAQTYYSITRPGVARDEDFWHCHRYQDDRFVVLLGDLVIAIADARPGSPTRGTIGLFKLGESRGDEQTELLIPRNTLHGFVVVGERPAVLVNYPTQLYNPSDELRIPFAEADVRLPDGVPFSWDLIRDREGMTR